MNITEKAAEAALNTLISIIEDKGGHHSAPTRLEAIDTLTRLLNSSVVYTLQKEV